MLTITPTISGLTTGTEGGSYVLNLSPSNDPTIQSWTIDWGDGQVQTILGSPASYSHPYADGTKQYLIDASVKDTNNKVYLSNSTSTPVAGQLDTSFNSTGDVTFTGAVG